MMQEHEGYWLKSNTVLSGRYTTRRVLGEGGMGIVYLGYDQVLETQVSIKEYFPRQYAIRKNDRGEIQTYEGTAEQCFSQGLDRFIHEARILAKFSSIDSIVMVKDFFYENGTAYIVMEFVEGESIKSLVEREGKMEPQKVLSLMRPILYDLDLLHKQGLLHRDISPDNILLRENGRAVLIDFGAARMSENQENKTMTVFFKRGYSAEEQYMERLNKGAYTDVYGACATMYFMLTGIQPEESIRRILRDNVVPLTKFHDISMPKSVKEAIMKGMAVRSTKRYATMGLLCKDLYEQHDLKKVRKYVLRTVVIVFLLFGIGGGVKIWNLRSFSKDAKTTNPIPISASKVVSSQGVTTENKEKETVEQFEQVPDIKGLKISQANSLLQSSLSNVSIKKKYAYSKKIPKGKVIGQSVKAKKTVKKGEKVSIIVTISKGKKGVKVSTTPVPESSQEKTEKTKKENKIDELEGVLPW